MWPMHVGGLFIYVKTLYLNFVNGLNKSWFKEKILLSLSNGSFEVTQFLNFQNQSLQLQPPLGIESGSAVYYNILNIIHSRRRCPLTERWRNEDNPIHFASLIQSMEILFASHLGMNISPFFISSYCGNLHHPHAWAGCWICNSSVTRARLSTTCRLITSVSTIPRRRLTNRGIIYFGECNPFEHEINIFRKFPFSHCIGDELCPLKMDFFLMKIAWNHHEMLNSKGSDR